MRFRILGPLEVRSRDGELVRLGSVKLRTVLAMLLLEANQPVSADRLIDAVWPRRPTPSASGALRTYVSTLRRQLRLTGAETLPRLDTEAAGYRLRVAPADLDLLVFEELATQGERALLDGAAAVAAERLHRCVAMWRGRPLEDVAVGPDLEGRLANLTERRLVVAEALAAARLDLGQHAEVAAELPALAREQPLRERLWELWMLALYRTGRQAEALAVFHTLHQTLAQELGIEPGRSVRELHRRILDAEPSLDPPAPAPLATAMPRQLPPDITGFTGRVAELDALREVLGRCRQPGPAPVAAIDGPGGIGKSALAVHAAHGVSEWFPDGQLYAELYGTAHPVPALEVLGRFLRAVGVAGTERMDLAEATARFRAETAARRLLVVLDDAAEAAQVRPLLPAGPGCAVLLTSRQILSTVDGASHVHLGVLPGRDAVALLGRLAGTTRIAADRVAAERITALCGRLPLALRIAGARLAARPSWPVRALADRLADARRRLDELRVADLDVRASLRVSHAALAAGSQADRAAAAGFGLLGLPDGEDLGLPVAQQLLGVDAPAAEAIMERLTDAQLVASRSPGRYQLHDLLRLLARELAEERHPPAARLEALIRAMRWQLATVWRAFGVLRPGDNRPVAAGQWAEGGQPFHSAAAALAWLETERANLVAAVDQAAATPGIPAEIPTQLARALFAFFHIRGHWPEWVRVNRTALTVAGRTKDRLAEGFAHRDLGAVHELLGDYGAAESHLRSALGIFTELGDRMGQAACFNGLGTVYDSLGRLEAAADCAQRALAIARDLGDRHSQAIYLNNLGPLHSRLGRHGEALHCLERAKAILVELGNRRSQAACLTHLGEVYAAQGSLGDALANHGESLAIFTELGDEAGRAHCLTQLGRANRALGRQATALDQLRESLAICERGGDRRGTADNLRELAETLDSAGRSEEAVAAWRRALPILEILGVPAATEVRARLATHLGQRQPEGVDVAPAVVTVGPGEDHSVGDNGAGVGRAGRPRRP